MIVNSESVALAFKGFKTVFTESLLEAPTYAEQIAMTVPSSSRDETYGWMGQFPSLREWVGPRQIKNLEAHGFTIKNRKFESTIEISRDDISDDLLGIFKPMFAEMGQATRVEGLAAAIKVWGGSIVTRNAAGYLTKGATATLCTGVGRAEATAGNSAGAAGALTVDYRQGIFLFANSAAGDLITIADIGKLCYNVDDQTVAKTDGTATRSRAGGLPPTTDHRADTSLETAICEQLGLKPGALRD